MGTPGRGTSPRPDASWAWVGVGGVFVAASVLSAVQTRDASGGRLALWSTLQIVTTALAFLVPQARAVVAARGEATAEEREIEARVETRVAVNDALDPIVRLLGSLAVENDPTRLTQLRAEAVPLVLKTAAEFVGPDRSRACWFRLEPGPPRTLEPTSFAGRAGSPSTTFTEGTPAGDATIGFVLADRDLRCSDVRAEPPTGWDTTKDRDYRAFISVSVIAGDTALGMLTLDAVEPDSLDDDDMGLLRLMAGLLAVAQGSR